MSEYITLVGLELHAQLQTETKMFCSCANEFTTECNTHICPVCMAAPGSLPVPNRKAVVLGIRAGRALGCVINPVSRWDRKNYFYPDMPKAYQITQQRSPLCGEGRFRFMCGDEEKLFLLRRIHLEEDAAKLVHGNESTIIDFNRAGVPLIEIVTEPCLHSGSEAAAAAEAIALALRYAGVCDGRLEQGSLRVDVNVSLHRNGSVPDGKRIELKNLGSFRSVERAVRYEAKRLEELLRQGAVIENETRRFDEKQGVTYPMRSKESAADYRYMPEPDIPPLVIDEELLNEANSTELPIPFELCKGYIAKGVSAGVASAIVAEPEVCSFFERLMGCGIAAVEASLFVSGEVLRLQKTGIEVSSMHPESAAMLLRLKGEGRLSALSVKELAERLVLPEAELKEYVEQNGYLIAATAACDLDALVGEVLTEQGKALGQYLAGKTSVVNFLFGQLMKKVGRNATAEAARSALNSALEKMK